MTYERVGKGTEEDPVRLCPELYTEEGRLIARQDSCNPKNNRLNLEDSGYLDLDRGKE